MAILTQEPPRPIIHSSPPPSLIFRNIHFSEWVFAFAVGGVTFLIGALHKQPRVLRNVNKYTFGVSGFIGYDLDIVKF